MAFLAETTQFPAYLGHRSRSICAQTRGLASMGASIRKYALHHQFPRDGHAGGHIARASEHVRSPKAGMGITHQFSPVSRRRHGLRLWHSSINAGTLAAVAGAYGAELAVHAGEAHLIEDLDRLLPRDHPLQEVLVRGARGEQKQGSAQHICGYGMSPQRLLTPRSSTKRLNCAAGAAAGLRG